MKVPSVVKRFVLVVGCCSGLAGAVVEVDKSCEIDTFLGLGTPKLTASCVFSLLDLAFDPAGNLWLSDRARVLRLPKSSLPVTEMSRADIVIGKPGFTILDSPYPRGACSDGSEEVSLGH